MSKIDEIRQRYKQGETAWHLDDIACLLSQLKDGGAEDCVYCDSSLGCAEHGDSDELQQLRREFELSGLGDRPSSMSAAKLRRLMQLERIAATAPTETRERCVLCGHDGFLVNGLCVQNVQICSDDYHGYRSCGHKCVFPASTELDVFAAALEQLKGEGSGS